MPVDYLNRLLIDAVSKTSVDNVEILLNAGADVNFELNRPLDESVLSVAIEHSNTAMVQFLLANGAEPNYKNCLAMKAALRKGVNEEIILLLLEAGSNINMTIYYDGPTLLMEMVDKEFLEAIKFLLKKKVNVNKGIISVYDRMTGTPITKAIIKGNLEIVELLLKNGAEVNAELFRLSLGGRSLGIVKLLLEKENFLDYRVYSLNMFNQPQIQNDILKYLILEKAIEPRDDYLLMQNIAQDKEDNVKLLLNTVFYLTNTNIIKDSFPEKYKNILSTRHKG